LLTGCGRLFAARLGYVKLASFYKKALAAGRQPTLPLQDYFGFFSRWRLRRRTPGPPPLS